MVVELEKFHTAKVAFKVTQGHCYWCKFDDSMRRI